MRAFVVLCLVAFAVADVSELAGNGYNYPQPAGSDGGLKEGAGGDTGSMGDNGGFMGGDGGSMEEDGGSMQGESEQMGGDGGSMNGSMDGEGGATILSAADLGSATADKPNVAGMDSGSFMGSDGGSSMGADLGGGAPGGSSSGGFGFRESVPMRPDLGYESVDTPTVSKRFFTVTAEDTDDGEDEEESSSNARGHKSYDVIFANNPATSSLKSALRAVSKFAGDHETNVYVLSQQLGAKQLGAAIKASGIKPSKPHVHFVKYKSPQEAALAQQQIRAQYDRLGGSSENGGHETSPVRSVVGGGRRGSSSGSLGGGYGNYGNYGNNGGYSGYGNNAGYGGRPGGFNYRSNGGYSGRPSGFGGFTHNVGYSSRPNGFASSAGFGGRPAGQSYGYRGGYGGRPSSGSSFGFSNRYLPPRY